MIDLPISDWNVVVAILFGLTLTIPLAIVGLIKAEIYVVNKIKKSKKN